MKVIELFQLRSPCIRPAIDEIVEPANPSTIVLKYLQDDLLSASNSRRMNGKEIEYVSKQILEALRTLHDDGFVHTDIKMDNVLGLLWGTPTDIWSFSAVPDVPRGHDEYEVEILSKYHIFFGPFPRSLEEIADDFIMNALLTLMLRIPPEKLKPFRAAGENEISKEDKEFVLKIMKIDPRDRPTANELLQDEWFKNV
ncbi:hypothetical protein FQN57_005518 [Myotisia sp. PD_48]|nr:hypothetical protein FQN57_005518 [Myotisia sp. PD_48]